MKNFYYSLGGVEASFSKETTFQNVKNKQTYKKAANYLYIYYSLS